MEPQQQVPAADQVPVLQETRLTRVKTLNPVSLSTAIAIGIVAAIIGAFASFGMTATVLHGSLEGDRGATGVEGPQGDRGRRGKRGPSGYNGADGATVLREEACSNDLDVPLPYC
jgi:hypothetical protein